MMIHSLNSASVVCFTEHYSFRATVLTGNKRLSDLLNDKSSDYLELSDVEVYRIIQLNAPVMHTKEFYLKKERIILVAILSEERGTRAGRLYSYVPRQRRPVVLMLSTFEVQGYIHLQSKWEIYGPIAREGDTFIPVTEAMATAVYNPKVNFKAPTILIHENALQGFYVQEEE